MTSPTDQRFGPESADDHESRSEENRSKLEPVGVVPSFLFELFQDVTNSMDLGIQPERLEIVKEDTATVSRSGRNWLQNRLRPYTWMATTAAVLIAIVSAISTFGLSQTLSATRSLYEVSTAELKEKRRDLSLREKIDQQILRRTSQEEAEHLLVRYISPADFVKTQTGNVKVTARNVRFPCFLIWTVNGKSQTITLPSGETSLELPIGGPVTLFCRAHHTYGWLQTVQVWAKHDTEKPERLGSALGTIPLTLADQDEVTVFFEDPVSPWNAICVPVRDEFLHVTLERPRALFQYEIWKAGHWKAQEEFPNSAMCWAKEGSLGLAKELAATFISQRSETNEQYDFRGAMHTSLFIQSDGKLVSSMMRQISQEELETVLFNAFEQLKRKMSPNGNTVQDEINQATQLLNAEE
jgi:hypothetical protein